MEGVKKIITSLLISSPLQLTMSALDRDYAEQIGERIPYRVLGYCSLETCLRSMTDILEVDGQGPNAKIIVHVTQNSAHINDLVTKQRVILPKRKSRFGVPVRSQSVRRTNSSRASENYTRNSEILFTPSYDQWNSPNQIKLNNVAISSTHLSCSNNKAYGNGWNSANTSTPVTHQRASRSTTKSMVGVPMRSQSVKSNNRRSYEEGRKPSSFKNQRNPNDVVPNHKVPSNIQDNLRRVMYKYDSGIWCRDLPKLYKEMWNAELDYTKYGYKALIFMCMDLPHIFIWRRPDAGDHKLFSKAKGVPKENDNCSPKVSPEPFVLQQFARQKLVCEEDVISCHEKIPKSFLPNGIPEDNCIEVIVGEIYDPGKFYLVPYGSSNDLDKLTSDMQNFYASVTTYIPQAKLVQDMYCVTIYHTEYQRAIVVDTMVNTPNKVRVCCIDYGSELEVPSNSLKFLHRQFCNLPQQAMQAKLHGLYPCDKQSEWPRKTSYCFLDFVRNKPLIAMLHEVDFEKQILSVDLVDTLTQKDIFLSDVLVNEGHAITFQVITCKQLKDLDTNTLQCSTVTDKPERSHTNTSSYKMIIDALQQISMLRD